MAARAAGLDEGIPFADMLVEIATSPEAVASASGTDLAKDCSDGEFLMIVGRLLNGRGLVPTEIASGQRFLNEEINHAGGLRTKRFLATTISPDKRRCPSSPRPETHAAGRCQILGTNRILTREAVG